MSQKNVVYVTKIIGLPLISGIMLLCSASLYMLMLTLGSHRPDCSVLGLALFMFMMKCESSCSAAKLVQATFLQVPDALFSEFFQKLFRLLLIQKTFPAQG